MIRELAHDLVVSFCVATLGELASLALVIACCLAVAALMAGA